MSLARLCILPGLFMERVAASPAGSMASPRFSVSDLIDDEERVRCGCVEDLGAGVREDSRSLLNPVEEELLDFFLLMKGFESSSSEKNPEAQPLSCLGFLGGRLAE